jgi:hypothetical protein
MVEQTLSFRVAYWLAALLLFLAAALRTADLTSLPGGVHAGEITDMRVTERVRLGTIEVFYDLRTPEGEGREGLYHTVTAIVTAFIGNGPLGYHLVSMWASLLTLGVVYALVTRLYGPLAGITALALLVLNLPYILAGRMVSREIFLPGLVAGVMLVLARGLAVYREPHPTLPLNTIFAALGLMLGLGFYLHPIHFFVVLFAVLFIILRLSTQRSRRLPEESLPYLRFSLVVLIIIITPYLVSSIRLPELSGIQRLWGGYSLIEHSLPGSILNSLGGLIFLGDANPVHNLAGRPLVDLFSGLLLIIGLLVAGRDARQLRYALPILAGVCLLPATLLAPASPDFQRMLPLLPLIALFVGLGVQAIYQSINTRLGGVVGWLALIALFAFNLQWTLRDLFQAWPQQPGIATAFNTRIGLLARELDRTGAEQPTLICDTPVAGSDLNATDQLLLMMNRTMFAPRFADCGSGLVFINGGEGQQIAFPRLESYERLPDFSRQWLEQGRVEVDPLAPPDSLVRLNVAATLADRLGQFTTTAPVAYAPEGRQGQEGPVPPPVRFGGNLTFAGYEPQPEGAYQPGGVVTVITWWRVDGPLPPDLRFFIHILSDPAAIVTQNDSISVDVTTLQPRDVFAQITFVPLPLTLPDGIYTLSIGAVQAQTEARLPVLDEAGGRRGDRLFIGTIVVRR